MKPSKSVFYLIVDFLSLSLLECKLHESKGLSVLVPVMTPACSLVPGTQLALSECLLNKWKNDQQALHDLTSAYLPSSFCTLLIAPSAQENCITCSFQVPLGPLCLCTCHSLCLPVYVANSWSLVKSQLSGYLLCEALLDFSRQMIFSPLLSSRCTL